MDGKQTASEVPTEYLTVSLDELAAIAKSAGIEVSLEEATEWLEASSELAADPGEFEVFLQDGIGGFELAVLDFDPASAARLRQIGELIATRPRPNVQVGLAIAGSAAQSRIQPFPADSDFFERVHITAPTVNEAREILAEIVRVDTLNAMRNDQILLDDVCFGSGGGKALRWQADTLSAGSIAYSNDQDAASISWSDAAHDPGFIKVAWILVDPNLGGPGLASKVIDATWEDPNGEIATLDSMIDGEFQQVYLDASGAELASIVAKSVSDSARAKYVSDLEAQIAYYSCEAGSNYAKVAKRLYNVCRITGRYTEALYLRELFDEPPAKLIQVEARLYVASRLAESDPAEALADVRRSLNDCTGLVEFSEINFGTIDQDVRSETVVDLINALLRVVSGSATAAFALRLRAFDPISRMLDDIAERFPQAASPHH